MDTRYFRGYAVFGFLRGLVSVYLSGDHFGTETPPRLGQTDKLPTGGVFDKHFLKKFPLALRMPPRLQKGHVCVTVTAVREREGGVIRSSFLLGPPPSQVRRWTVVPHDRCRTFTK